MGLAARERGQAGGALDVDEGVAGPVRLRDAVGLVPALRRGNGSSMLQSEFTVFGASLHWRIVTPNVPSGFVGRKSCHSPARPDRPARSRRSPRRCARSRRRRSITGGATRATLEARTTERPANESTGAIGVHEHPFSVDLFVTAMPPARRDDRELVHVVRLLFTRSQSPGRTRHVDCVPIDPTSRETRDCVCDGDGAALRRRRIGPSSARRPPTAFSGCRARWWRAHTGPHGPHRPVPDDPVVECTTGRRASSFFTRSAWHPELGKFGVWAALRRHGADRRDRARARGAGRDLHRAVHHRVRAAAARGVRSRRSSTCSPRCRA